MKQNKVKGFTLIELILVMAIFTAILASATSMMVPIQKIMGTTSSMEAGNAAATNLTTYLKNSLSASEYMYVCPAPLADADIPGYVETFTNAYYSGIVADGTANDGSVINYASGLVHVLRIDNAANGEVRQFDYLVSFDPANADVRQINPTTYVPGSFNSSTMSGSMTAEYTYSANQAFYDNYRFLLLPGMYATTDEFNTAYSNYQTNATQYLTDIRSEITPASCNLTLKTISTVTCPHCGNHFDAFDEVTQPAVCPNCGKNPNKTISAFVNASTFPLVNIQNRFLKPPGNGAVQMLYFVVDHVELDPIAAPGVLTPRLVDRGNTTFHDGTIHPILSGYRVLDTTDGVTPTVDGITFIYTYGPEIYLD